MVGCIIELTFSFTPSFTGPTPSLGTTLSAYVVTNSSTTSGGIDLFTSNVPRLVTTTSVFAVSLSLVIG